LTAPGTAVRTGILLALTGVVLFSFTLPFTKIALRGYDPVVIAMGRAAIAGVVAGVALRLAGARWPGPTALRPLLGIGLGVVVGFPVLTTTALQSTTSAHAAVVIAGLPIATAVLGVVRAGEHPSRSFWYAAVSGTVALAVFALSRGGASGGDLVADLLLLGAVLAAAYGYVEGAVLSRRMPGWQVISWVLVVMLPVTVTASAVSWAASTSGRAPTGESTAALLYLALVSMYLGFCAWYAGLHRAGVARASQVQLLQPLLTLLWSVLLLGEAVGLLTILAAVAVLACVVWTQRARAVPAGDDLAPEAP
jgi:drug/metabolite transporter (DMT)-like permease